MQPTTFTTTGSDMQPTPQAYQRIDAIRRPHPPSHPRSSGAVWFCFQLAVFPGSLMAKAASPRHMGLLRIAVFSLVSAIYFGGIVCFTVSSTLHDSVFITNEGEQITDTVAVFFVAWALYVVSPFATVAIDLGIWFRWGLASGLDDKGDREYNANSTSIALIVVHLLCQLVITVAMMIQSCEVETDAWNPTCLGVCCCGCCCPHWWLGSALAAADSEQQSHDQLPAYDL